MHLSYPQKSNGMYILSQNDMNDIAEMVLKGYMPQALKYPMPVDATYLAEEFYGLLIESRTITIDRTILGLITFGRNRLQFYDALLRLIE